MEGIKDLISIDNEILCGQPVFKGTGVPMETLLLHLEKEISLNEFLAVFHSVTKEPSHAVLDHKPTL